MTHRGPNDRGTYAADGVALGVRRLSIVDVAGGHQPVANEDGSVWAVQNGELYNHGEVRDRLRSAGHRFETRCDTEILPHLYEAEGAAYPEHLRGKFAIAVWDGRERRAVIARDRLGVKPLYYAEAGDLLVFASELKSLLASGLVGTELDYEAIDAFLSFGFVPGPMTPLAAVRKLMPGHRLVVEGGSARTEEYWSYPEPSPVEMSLDEAGERVLSGLDESVRLRLMSDVPLGAMLSGGIDSSVIVALMARHMTEPVKTFSVGFAEAGEGNELADARFVAAEFGTDHHELELSFSDQTVDLAELVWAMDEPLADLSSLGFLALSELAASEVTVALSGQGADELLGGYRKHRAAAIAGTWTRLPGPLRAAGNGALRYAPARVGRASGALTATDPAERLLVMSGRLGPQLRGKLARGPLAELDGGTALRIARERLGDVGDDPLPAALYLDGQLGLVDDMLHYFDRASMAHSLEVRVPFLDHHLVELCATIPSRHKVHRLDTKHVLKHGARGLIPDRVIDKRKIGFFHRAVDSWFQAQTRGAISDYLLGPNPRYAEMLDRGEVERLVHGHADGTDTGNGHVLLSILMLEVWLSSYVPRALEATPHSTGEHPRPVIRSYAIVTPARDEADNLPRLAACLAEQSIRPAAWKIVDNGSTDGTREVAESIAAEHAWVEVLSLPGSSAADRGAPVVRALTAGIAALEEPPEILVNVDADISMRPHYFERLLARFDDDPSLGIASGSAFEQSRGEWKQRFVTGSTVWGASRAYRWECLQELLPLEERVGWDGVDEFKANSHGWRTAAFEELPFHHHRREGERDGSTWQLRRNQGEAAYYLGYRSWYLVLRALWHARREPAALGMVWGFTVSAVRRDPRNPDAASRAYLRSQQSPCNLRRRALEASGQRGRLGLE